MSASVNLPLHHKVQKFSSGAGSPGWSQKMGRKTVVVWCGTTDDKTVSGPTECSSSDPSSCFLAINVETVEL